MIDCKYLVRFFQIVMLLAASLPVFAELQVSVDRTRVSLQDSINLTIESTEGDPSDLDLSPITLFFDIAQRGLSTSVNIVNGNWSKTKTLQLLLIPKQIGEVIIPSFELKGETSKKIQIDIRAATTSNNNQQSTASPAYVTLTTDVTDIKVQQQLIVTVKLVYKSNLFIDGQLADLAPSNSVLNKIDEQTYQENANGIVWQVHERRYAVFPQKSGPLTIPPVRFQGTMQDGRQRSIFRQGRPYSANSNALEISVDKPAYTDAYWLPADNLTVTSTLDRQQVAAGEPVTRIIHLRARGQIGEQLSKLPLATASGIQSYQDKAEVESTANSHGIDGSRVETMVIIPEQSGTVHIPDQYISWWDNRTQQRQQLTIPGHTLTVLPALSSSAQASPPNNNPLTEESPSSSIIADRNGFDLIDLILTVLLVISLLCNLVLLLRRRTTAPTAIDTPDDEQRAYTNIRTQLPQVDAAHWHTLINPWLEQMNIQPCLSIRQLISLLKRHSRQEEKQQFDTLKIELNAWIYHQGDTPDVDYLLTLCQRLRKDNGYPKNYSVPGFSLSNV